MNPIAHKSDQFVIALYQEVALTEEIGAEAPADRVTRLTQAEAAIAAEVAAYQAERGLEIAAFAGERVSRHLQESRERLQAARQAVIDEVAEEVRGRIRRFTATSAYTGHLEALKDRVLTHLDVEDREMIQLREETLGGLMIICKSRRMQVDLTFDTALSAALARLAFEV
ncbi:MAG: hypothetical protein FWC72_06965 [Oscillospiraceae bacterium]|nr:hypothetical protein [Oscillospiraceae bacterium]